jgi:hypothetical protein
MAPQLRVKEQPFNKKQVSEGGDSIASSHTEIKIGGECVQNFYEQNNL